MKNKLMKIFVTMLICLVALPAVMAVSVTPSTAYTSDTLTCSGASGYVVHWFRNSVDLGIASSTLSYTYTTRGDSVYCQPGVNDFGSWIPMGSASAPITILNSAPTTPSVSFTGQPYYAASTITVAASSSDADGDAFTLNYAFVNSTGDILGNSSSNTLACTGICRKGVNVTAIVTATDSVGASSESTLETAILNTAPAFSSIVPINISVGQVLDVNATVVDADGENLTYVYQFYNLNDAVVVQNYSSTDTYTVALTDSHNTLEVYVNVSDSETSTLGAVNITVLNSLVAWTLGNQSFDQNTSKEFNLSQYVSDGDNDIILGFYAVSSANITATIVNTTNVTLVPDTNFVGSQYINLTADDGYENSTLELYVTINDLVPPTVTVTAPALVNDSVNVTVNYTMLDNGVLDYCWYTSNFDSGSNVSCTGVNHTLIDVPNGNHTVTFFANDSSGNAANASANFTVDYNTVPVLGSVNLTSLTAYTNTDLVCNFTMTDREDTSLLAYFTWFRNGAANLTGNVSVTNGTETLLTLASGNTTKSETWLCEILPSDTRLNGTALNSSSATILNSVPTVSTLPNFGWGQNTNQTVNFTNYFSDLDLDDLTFILSSLTNITSYVDNSTDTVILEPDTGFIGSETVVFTAFDSDSANVSSNTVTLSVGLTEVLGYANVNGTYYAPGNYSNISGVMASTLNSSNVTDPTISVLNSTLINSNVTDSTLENCVVIDTVLLGAVCLNAYIDPSDVRYSNFTGSDVYDSTIWDSNATNSFVNLTQIYNSSIDGSNMTNAELTNVTMTGSVVLDSNLSNTVIDSANVTNGTLYSGTMLMSNGTVYNATANGAQNVTELINSAPVAGISASATSVNPGATITFTSTSTDVNLGTMLNDSLTYLWLFGDGSNATTENSSHSYSSAGNYNVNLTVTDSFGEVDSTIVAISVSTPSSGGSSSGGGGSVSGYRIDLINNPVKTLTTNQFVVFNFAGQDHRVTLNKVSLTFIMITVQSDPVRAAIEVGKSEKFDLNSDGYYDLEVEVQTLTAYTATMKFNSIIEKVPTTVQEPTEQEPVDDETPEENETVVELEVVEVSKWNAFTGKVVAGWDTTKEFTKKNKLYFGIGFLVVAVLIAVVIVLRYKNLLFSGKKKKYGVRPLSQAKSVKKNRKPFFLKRWLIHVLESSLKGLKKR